MNVCKILFPVFLAVFCLATSSAFAQADRGVALKAQSQLLLELRSDDPKVMVRALEDVLYRISPEERTEETKTALIETLERMSPYSESSLLADPEFAAEIDHELPLRLLKDGVLPLEDPSAARAIAGMLDTGGSATNAMIAMGPVAADVILSMLRHPDNPENMAVLGPQITLRMMIDYYGLDAFTDRQRSQMKELVLSQFGRDNFDEDWRPLRLAIELAGSLEDSELMDFVELVANDQDIMIRSGIVYEWALDSVQQTALDALAGTPFLPQYDPNPVYYRDDLSE